MHYHQWQWLSRFNNTNIWELHRGVYVLYLRSLSQIHPSLHLIVQFFFEAVILCHELLNLILFEEKYNDMKIFAKFQQDKKNKKGKINRKQECCGFWNFIFWSLPYR